MDVDGNDDKEEHEECEDEEEVEKVACGRIFTDFKNLKRE